MSTAAEWTEGYDEVRQIVEHAVTRGLPIWGLSDWEELMVLIHGNGHTDWSFEDVRALAAREGAKVFGLLLGYSGWYHGPTFGVPRPIDEGQEGED